MNYTAPTQNPPTEQKSSFWERFAILSDFFEHLYGLFVELPLYILDKAGVTNIPNIFSMNLPLGSLCVCFSIFAMMASIGIALGVGLGVGLSCQNDNVSFNNATSSSTNITSATSTTSTTAAIVTTTSGVTSSISFIPG